MNTLPISREQLIAGLTQTRQVAASAGGNLPFLKLARSGHWAYGQDETPVSPDDVWAVNVHSIQRGYISWGDGEVLDERMVGLLDQPIDRSDLPETGAGWDPQIGMDLVCVDGEAKGQGVLYRTTSHGGRRACDNLISLIISQVQAGSEEYVPAIYLRVDSYQHKKYGKTFVPNFEIQNWYGPDATNVVHDEDEAEEEPPPPRTARSRLLRRS